MSDGTKGSMRAFALTDFETPPGVHELPIPEFGPGELLVRIHAASINAFDAAVAAGALKDMMEYRFPVIVGKDFSGVVEDVGEGVTRFGTGDQVVGLTPPAEHLERGTYAEYVVVPAEGFLVPKPTNLDFPQAAALGLAGTAAQVAVDAVDPSEGDRILIAGATGGVGSLAVQLGAGRGARVIATSLPADEESMRHLGAAETVDYSGDVVASVGERHPEGIEGLIDLVSRDPQGFGTLAELVRPGGRAVSSLGAADVEHQAARGVTASNFNAQTDAAAFRTFVAAAAARKVRVPVERVFALEEAGRGLELIATGKARGKSCVSLVG